MTFVAFSEIRNAFEDYDTRKRLTDEDYCKNDFSCSRFSIIRIRRS